jgi:hypothetical protein
MNYTSLWSSNYRFMSILTRVTKLRHCGVLMWTGTYIFCWTDKSNSFNIHRIRGNLFVARQWHPRTMNNLFVCIYTFHYICLKNEVLLHSFMNSFIDKKHFSFTSKPLLYIMNHLNATKILMSNFFELHFNTILPPMQRSPHLLFGENLVCAFQVPCCSLM